MHKGDQKENRGLRYIAVKPEIYDRLLQEGRMKDSFSDVVEEIMKKAGIVVGPDYDEQGETS